jgi:hypothetical protein
MREKVGEGCDDPDLMFHEAKGKPRGTYDADELRSRDHARHSAPCPLSVGGQRGEKQIAGHPRPDLHHRNVSGLGGIAAQLEWLRVSAPAQNSDWQTFVCLRQRSALDALHTFLMASPARRSLRIPESVDGVRARADRQFRMLPEGSPRVPRLIR